MYRANILLLLTAHSIAYGSHVIETSFYGSLTVHLGVKDPELSSAFRRKGRSFHPDKNQDPNAIKQFKDLNHMYQILKDPARRKEYDSELAIELLQSNSEFAHVIGYQMQEEDIMKKPLQRVFCAIFPFFLCCKKDNGYTNENA